MQALRSSLAASRDCGGTGPAISWTSEKGAMSPNPRGGPRRSWWEEADVLAQTSQESFCKKNEKRNGEERR